MATTGPTIDSAKQTCLGCGLVCDDLEWAAGELAVDCPLARDFFAGFDDNASTANYVNGQAATTAEALTAAGEILSNSRASLVYGFAQSSVGAQRAGVALADRLGGYCDPALARFHRAALVALQSVGLSTCTLGEVHQRADVILFWGCDPATTHPRLWERFVERPSRWLPRGRADRTVFSVQPRETPVCRQSDDSLQLAPTETYPALNLLRAFVGGHACDAPSLAPHVAEKLTALAEKLISARYAVVFFGHEVAPAGEESETLESLFLLVRALNSRGRCAAIGLGALLTENVLTWQTGYPCGVSFAAGYPRYAPEQYAAERLLVEQAVDAVVTIGGRLLEYLSAEARDQLQRVPWIALMNAPTSPATQPTVQLATCHAASAGGSYFRLDGVPLRTAARTDSALPTEAELLELLLNQLP